MCADQHVCPVHTRDPVCSAHSGQRRLCVLSPYVPFWQSPESPLIIYLRKFDVMQIELLKFKGIQNCMWKQDTLHRLVIKMGASPWPWGLCFQSRTLCTTDSLLCYDGEGSRAYSPFLVEVILGESAGLRSPSRDPGGMETCFLRLSLLPWAGEPRWSCLSRCFLVGDQGQQERGCHLI